MLYVVATPIGNLEDISKRALRILAEVDIIAAEDTRTAQKLFRLLDVKTTAKWISCHKFNEAGQCDYLLEQMRTGQSVALLSDAGTPCISDPGYWLVQAAAAQGIPIYGIGGTCAAVVALSVSGFPADRFLFLGFLPRREAEIRAALRSLDEGGPTLVFYESPKRVTATVQIIATHFPHAALCLCNDLTKKFEHTYRGAAAEVLADLQANPNAQKGEYTCVVFAPKRPKAETAIPKFSAEALLTEAMIKHQCTLKEAVQLLAAEKPAQGGYSKNDYYAAGLRLKDMFA